MKNVLSFIEDFMPRDILKEINKIYTYERFSRSSLWKLSTTDNRAGWRKLSQVSAIASNSPGITDAPLRRVSATSKNGFMQTYFILR